MHIKINKALSLRSHTYKPTLRTRTRTHVATVKGTDIRLESPAEINSDETRAFHDVFNVSVDPEQRSKVCVCVRVCVCACVQEGLMTSLVSAFRDQLSSNVACVYCWVDEYALFLDADEDVHKCIVCVRACVCARAFARV